MSTVGLLAPRPRLRDGVGVRTDGDALVLTAEGRSTRLRGLPSPVRTLVARLHDDRASDDLSDTSDTSDTSDASDTGDTGDTGDTSDAARASADRVLARLGHLMTTVWCHGEHEVMRHESTARGASYDAATLADTDRVRLDRFALLRSRGDRLVLECPRSTHRFVLTSGLARGLAADLASPRSVGDVVAASGSPLLAREVLVHWVGAGLVERADPAGEFGSDRDPVLVQWDFHDLLMHSRSRSGRYDEPLGALSPYRERFEPLPAVTPPRPVLAVTPLPAPSPWTAGLSLAEAVDRRRSVRDYADEEISLPELSTFLARSFRDRARFDPPSGAGVESKVSRPYPSGGGLYEHELYLTVRRCTGLAPGIYHYDALAHRLELVSDATDARSAMLAVAGNATGHPASPDVLLTLTARFQRVSWRYRSIAYANILRTTGAIYQTMYLVATDLDLAPCALGNGDADLAARVLGLDYLQESSVGDLVLGRRARGDVVDGDPLPGWTLLDTTTGTTPGTTP